MAAGDAISAAIRKAKAGGRPALVGYVTAGFPRRETFLQQLTAVADASDVVEIGVPFTDPMADGTTIQRVTSDQGEVRLPAELGESFELVDLIEDNEAAAVASSATLPGTADAQPA